MTRRWPSERDFLQELELRRLEREERRKAEARELHATARVGAATADELRQILPPAHVGKV